MACSANIDALLSQGATKTLDVLLRNRQLDKEALCSLDEAGHLAAWCDTTHWPKVYHAKNDMDDRHEDRNLGGLINLLLLWKTSMESMPDETIATDDADSALKALFRIGIDPAAISPTFSIGIQSATRHVIRLVVGKLEKNIDNPEECARCLSRVILGPLDNEIKRLRASDKKEESERFLSFPLTIRVATTYNADTPPPKLLSMMLCEMAVHALSTTACLSDSVDISWTADCLPASTRKTFAYASKALEKLLAWGVAIEDRAPHALATSESAAQAIRLGLSMLNFPYSQEENDGIASFLEKFNNQVDALTGRFSALAAGQDLFLQFLDRHWNTNQQYYRYLHERVTNYRSRAGISSPKQTTLKGFLNASPDSVATSP